MEVVDFDVKGMDALVTKITELGYKGSRIANTALAKAAEPILAEAVERAPISTYNKGRHARELLSTSRPYNRGNEKYVIVGLDRGDISEAFYLKFAEFGTSRQKATPFLGPAYEANKDKAMRILIQEMRRGLGLDK